MPVGFACSFLLLAAVTTPATAPPMDGLLLWLDTSNADSVHVAGDRVSRWDSQSPAGGALEAVGRQQPQWIRREGSGARPGILFDGINDVLVAKAFQQRAETWTLVVVATPYGPSGGGGAFCSACPAGGDDFDPGFTVDTYQSSAARFDQVSIEGAGRVGGQQDQLEQDYAYRTAHLLVVERDETEVRLFVDGAIAGGRPVTGATTIMDELRVGARHYAGREQAFYHGEIHAVLLYARVLPPEERTAIERAYFVSSAEREALAHTIQAVKEAPRMVAPMVVESWPSLDAFWAARPDGPLRDYPTPSDLPIRSDLREAITLSMQHLVSLFDADRDNEPFFFSNHRVDGTGEMHHSVNIGIPHVTGRCLLGEVAAFQATGLPIDPKGLEILRKYCRVSFDNPYGINSYTDPEHNNEKFVEFHNVREGLYSLWALIALGGDPWAQDTADRMISVLKGITDEQGHWSQTLIDATPMKGHHSGAHPMNAARAVEPLLALHRLTGSATALDLAGAYARTGLAHGYDAEGHFTEWTRSTGHVHSITSALAGITEYALLIGDPTMIDRCRQIMDLGVPEYHSSWGWGDEVFPDHPANVVGRGEINQTGDVVRTALKLGAAGYTKYYALAERYLRSMLLPAQHREAELRTFMRDNEHPARDAEFDVIRRTVGGYAMQLPNDRMREGDWPLSTLDITSGAVHAMAACYAARTTREDTTARVNLFFDYEDDAVRVESDLPLQGRIGFTAKAIDSLRIRVTEGVDAAALIATVNGARATIAADGGYAVISGLRSGDQGEVRFPFAVRQEIETVDSTPYTTTWLGEQIIDIQPRGIVSPLPF
jgi:hypothetical protein